MMTVQLENLNRDNWEEVAELAVADGQAGLIASNLYSIAESRFLPDFLTKAVVFEGDIVGFVMYGPDPDDGHVWLYRLMIDHRFQHRGLGRAALHEVVRDAREHLGAHVLRLGVAPENVVAKSLYESFGFRPTGLFIGGEDILQVPTATS
ncbi:GNAT family N-acetyltransferase [Rhodococcus sp. ABRD24]|uniref:GNAT family N-acetyltransferase n=1 Tax=Rhodococcus sp. ABRD24 TaxID=2507582 RepID=UPI00103D703F|nr:GNAT family N-acetyltransferase [Rhodococcus sp. ABRD24]QBJ97002.1 GNAT family N-acetyltransferase [Rhodococcus sp. ABRD24]